MESLLNETTSMKDKRYTLDTNILIYAVDRDAGKKHEKAMEIIERAIGEDCVLTVQSLSEFYSAATRKHYATPAQAIEFIQVWSQIFVVVSATPACLMNAHQGVQMYQLSFWDAMLWATAKQAGCRVIVSEDFQDKQIVEGVQFLNPLRRDVKSCA